MVVQMNLFDKIKMNIQKLNPFEIPLVLICCGSFSPITFSHLRMIEMAKDYFNHNHGNLKVVGGILSPVSDAYKKSGLIHSEKRLEMCRLASENDPLVSVDPWEATQPTWTPTLDVLTHFDHLFKSESSIPKEVKVMLLAGADLVEGFKNEKIWDPVRVRAILDYGVVVIERPNDMAVNAPEINIDTKLSSKPSGVDTKFSSSVNDDSSSIKKTDSKSANDEINTKSTETDPIDIYNHANIHRIPQPVPCEISSSKLRNLIKNDMSIKYLTSDKVIEYINENNLYK